MDEYDVCFEPLLRIVSGPLRSLRSMLWEREAYACGMVK
jgi:hypothetical protein